MPTSPSNHGCTKLELWKLVLKKYFSILRVLYVLRALVVGTPNVLMCTCFIAHEHVPCVHSFVGIIYIYISLYSLSSVHMFMCVKYQ